MCDLSLLYTGPMYVFEGNGKGQGNDGIFVRLQILSNLKTTYVMPGLL